MELFVGVVFVVVGIAGFVFVGRRRFYRRNVAGVEEFSGYGSMLGSRFFETSVRLVSFLLFVVGVILTIVGYAQG